VTEGTANVLTANVLTRKLGLKEITLLAVSCITLVIKVRKKL
jgi:hypothetical protein